MAFARFKTLKRDQHRHGRVACLLDVDVPRKKLIFNLLEARGLDAGFGKDRSAEDVYIQFRVQLLPAQDPVKVHKVPCQMQFHLSQMSYTPYMVMLNRIFYLRKAPLLLFLFFSFFFPFKLFLAVVANHPLRAKMLHEALLSFLQANLSSYASVLLACHRYFVRIATSSVN